MPTRTHRSRSTLATDGSVVRLDHFIVATRDSGYRGTGSAVAELVDNSLQAGASRVEIHIQEDEHANNGVNPLTVSVMDDGHGMDPQTLRQALRFGGTTRFDDRAGTGRYGMGLPNSSLSQARHVCVYSWRNQSRTIVSHLDVDEIASGHLTEVPTPRPASLPDAFSPLSRDSETLVVWKRCDRLDNRRISTLVRKLEEFLGRVFRYRLWKDLDLRINGKKVRPIDPLFLRSSNDLAGRASLFGEVMTYQIDRTAHPGQTGRIEVRFSQLPIEQWHELSNAEKRKHRITDQPIVSIVRGDREIDRGWFFMGAKRRENYDDWWRCELRFDPVLDEWFGITHTKQQVRPTHDLLAAVTPDLEAQGRALNLRVRSAHQALKTRSEAAAAESRASERDRLLTPLGRPSAAQRREFEKALGELPALNEWACQPSEPESKEPRFAIVEGRRDSDEFYEVVREGGQLAIILNRTHPFYKKIYGPLLESKRPEDKTLKTHIELLLIAAARAESVHSGAAAKTALNSFRREWGLALGAYLRG